MIVFNIPFKPSRCRADEIALKASGKLLPVKAGTQKLVEQYGQDLVWVRYRYDTKQRITFKMIELIIERATQGRRPHQIPPNKIVYVRIAVDETELIRTAKASGAKWNPQKKLWRLPYGVATALGLTGRIVSEKDDR